MRKMLKEDFIRKSTEKHGSKYDYSLSEYINTRNKVLIICKTHGQFHQLPKSHYNGQGCPRCHGNINLSKIEFIKISNRKEYDYDLLPKVVKMKDIIKITHKESGLIYFQWPKHHLSGLRPTKLEPNSLIKKLKEIHSDKYDYIINKKSLNLTDKIDIIDRLTGDKFKYRIDRHLIGMKPNKVTLSYFLLKAKEIHANRYDYSMINEIKGGKSKVNIMCKIHGIFSQRVSNHINLKDGCPKCAGVGKWSTEILKEEFVKVHLKKYDYTNVVFNGVNKKVEIVCRQHGPFLQSLYKHLVGQGCPECSSNSKGEEYVKNHLDEMKIKYIRQYGFDSCKYINKLSFDFYIPDLKTCIEFDGIQHFNPIKDFGGSKEFENIKNRDGAKNKWCLENGISLIRIKYDQINNIGKILNDNLPNVK
jgi:very-short-patch-repair endonuclease